MKIKTPFLRSLARMRLAILTGLVLPAGAAEFDVPSVDYPTLQSAIDAAALAANGAHFINLRADRLDTGAEVLIGGDFSQDKPLTIRPAPGIGLRRAIIASHNGSQPIMRLQETGYVTLQDLDLIRHATNNEDLMELVVCTNVVVERCRLGSDWMTVGSRNRRNLVIENPVRVIVRNCIFFSYQANNFEQAVEAILRSAFNRSVFLYNNVAADYRSYGFEIGAEGDAVVVMHNNVAVNRAGSVPEPGAYRSVVDPLVTLVTSHNTAFAFPGNDDKLAFVGASSIFGADAPLRFDPDEVGDAFLEFLWRADPAWDPNPDFFRLLGNGLLHSDASDAGVHVGDGEPNGLDIGVIDDIERDPRPTDDQDRTDRGADQIGQLTVGDIEVILPRIPVFSGVSVGSDGTEEFEIVEVGPQTDLPGNIPAEAMSGGEFSVAGAFVSIGTLRVLGFNELRLVPSPAPSGGNLMLSWPTTVRVISVQATADLAAPGSWASLPVQPVVNGETTSVTLPVTGSQRFFRLRY